MYYLYFDGGSRGNGSNCYNTRAGYGYVIYDNDMTRIADGCDYVGAKTNNYAEYSGLINGMRRAISLNIDNLTIRGDSTLVIKQMTGQFKVKHPDMKTLYTYSKELEKEIKQVVYEHVYRENNKEADRLSNIAMDNPKPLNECEDLLKKAQTGLPNIAYKTDEPIIISVKKRKI